MDAVQTTLKHKRRTAADWFVDVVIGCCLGALVALALSSIGSL